MIRVSNTVKYIILCSIIIILIASSILIGLSIKKNSYDTHLELLKITPTATQSTESIVEVHSVFHGVEEYNKKYPTANSVWSSMLTNGEDIVNDSLANSKALLSISPMKDLLNGKYCITTLESGKVVVKYYNEEDWVIVECSGYNAIPVMITKRSFSEEERYFISGGVMKNEIQNEDDTISLPLY